MFEHILVPLDGSSLAECVLPHVVAVTRACGARVTLLQVLERPRAPGPARFVDPLGWYITEAETRAYLDGWMARLQEAGLQAQGVLLEGPAAERIIEFVHTENVSLVLLSSHGRSGLSGWNVSSIVQKIILRAYVPAMIVRAYQPVVRELTGLRYQRLLVPLDGSQRAECVLPLVTCLARFHKSEVLLVHVVSKPQMLHRVPAAPEDIELVERITERNREEAARYLEQLRSRLEIDVRIRLLVGSNVATTLHDLAEEENVDLIVLSAHGYSGESRWPYGSLVVNFIGYGTTPLLIVQDLSLDKVRRTKAELIARERKGH